MKKHKGVFTNGLVAESRETDNGRLMLSVCRDQIYLIPAIGVFRAAYPYRFRVGFAFGIWYASIGFFKRNRITLGELLKRRMKKEHDKR